MKTLYIHPLSESSCLTHDGYIQIGAFNHSLKKHLELKRILNVNNSKLKEIESILPKIQGEIVKYQNYFTKELSSIKNVYNNGIK